MNRNRYRLVFHTTLGMMVPVAEIARRRGKAARGSALALAGVLLTGAALAEVPVPSTGVSNTGGVIPIFDPTGQASYQVNGTQAYVNQTSDKSILNWPSFNISAGYNVQFQQVDSLATNNLVPGANFTSLNRIWDINPSIIAGSISQAAGQTANVILVNSNGIAFMGGSQVNLNSFTASTLNIQDAFLDNFLPADSAAPQFEGALDGGAARGFIKVFENAQITAGKFGRVMLIAPTVVNSGTVTAPDGQIIAAAASKVYLRAVSGQAELLIEVDSPEGLADFDTANPDVKDGLLDGQTVSLVNAAEDKLGHVTNLGELSSPRGNVTMVGYAVNQMGIARATTSVVAGGSVYLLAKDTYSGNVSDPTSLRTGRVVLGQNSLTEILPEITDMTTTQDGEAGTGLDNPSAIVILGQDIRVEGASDGASGAIIQAPSGNISLIAADSVSMTNPDVGGSIFHSGTAASSAARIYIASGAKLDVAGLTGVAVEAGRSVVEIDLRGDELKDSPVNQLGPLAGEKVYLDVDLALANAADGLPTLVALDTLQGLKAQQQRTVAERSTEGGTVSVFSQGETIIADGVKIDLSGGSLAFAAGQVATTLLSSNGTVEDISSASAETAYDGIATRLVIDYGRWNVTEVIDLGQSYRTDPGYTEGKDAGALNIFGIGGVYAAHLDIVGRTVVGERQLDAGVQPKQASLSFGYQGIAGESGIEDYKINQNIDFTSTAALLPAGFTFGDALPTELKTTLMLDPALLGKDKVGELSVFGNQIITVREALRAPTGGAVTLAGGSIVVLQDIQAEGGSIELTASSIVASLASPAVLTPRVEIADGVTLATQGAWVNDLPAAGAGASSAPHIDGGAITLAAHVDTSNNVLGEVVLGEGVTLNADSGAWLHANGELDGGAGGAITLEGYSVQGLEHAEVHAYGVGKGGTLSLGANRIQIGGTPLAAPDALDFDPGFFSRGGFADFSLAALTRLEVADNTVIQPLLQSREMNADFTTQPSGAALASFSSLVVRDDRVRQAVNLSFTAGDKDTASGEVIIGSGARIELDPGATATLDALNLVDIEGTIRAPGGAITLTGGGEGSALGNIWLGSAAVLDVAGVARTYVDSSGLTQGEVLDGGTVSLIAVGIVTQAGSRIDVSGAAPVHLDVLNEAGGLGRDIASDAGTLNLSVEFAALLDGGIAAQAGAPGQRGGDFSFTLKPELPSSGLPPLPAVLRLAASTASQANGVAPEEGLLGYDTLLAADTLEAAGFDRIVLTSGDAIELEDGLNMGAGRALPLRELTLDAASIRTVGGDAALTAETVRLGNYSAAIPTSSASTASGTLTVNANQLELAGTLALEGMATAQLNGAEEIRLAGVSTDFQRPLGELTTTADLIFHGAVVAPASFVDYAILAPGKTVSFFSDGVAASQPWSAFGSLRVEAADILQSGNLWAPLGVIDLRADNTLVFTDGSLTSVAAAAGSVIPFGTVQNGLTWVFDLNTIADLPEKAILTSAAQVDMQPGARIDLSGGGDVQAYEFTVGPGGSHDILTDANTYAILPGFSGGYAPADAAQEDQPFDRQPGDAVYLSGVPGLADGVYTLLPAHYALLPGAYAVTLDAAPSLLPGQSYSRQDGVVVAAGYLTDTRVNAPAAADWQGIEVLTHAQVLARSEFTLTSASQFFAGGGVLPQDAGLLSITTSGVGADALKLNGSFDLAGAEGGHGGQVDIDALNLAIVSGTPGGLDPDAVVLQVDTLNALGADSLLIGGTRSVDGDTTTLAVGADSVTLANDAGHALQADEILLAANDSVTLKAGSAIDAQGEAGDAGAYVIAGNGAFVRAASSSATFTRSGSPDRSQGTLTGEVGSLITAADSVTLDATLENAFQGAVDFSKDGVAVAGNLGVGATRINFGAAPGGAEGITYTQAELDALNLKALTLTSYSTFDIYGDVRVGTLDAAAKPVWANLTLQGAGLAGIANAGQTAQINAQNVTFANAAAAPFTVNEPLGSGNLAVTADTLTLGAGDKAIQGWAAVTVTANELVGSGTGTLAIAAPVVLNVARISGQLNADQVFNSTASIVVAQYTADRVLAPVTALGAQWALVGTAVDFDSLAELPSGTFTLTATGGDVNLGAHARVDVAGRSVVFFDVAEPSWGGTAEFVSDTGNVNFAAGSNVDVSAAAGGDAGSLIVRASQGAVTLADGSVSGATPVDAGGLRGAGAKVEIDTGSLASFSTLNSVLNGGGFDGARTLRVRSGDVSIAETDTVQALDISIAVDGGQLDVAGTLDASGEDAGRIALFAQGDVNVRDTAIFSAVSSGALEDGGDIEIGTTAGSLNLAAGILPEHLIDVSSLAGGAGGTVLLRAPRIDGDTDVAVTALDKQIVGARSVVIEAVKTYGTDEDTDEDTADGIATLTATGTGSGTLSLERIIADNTAFAANYATIENRLNPAADPAFHILSGVEVRAPGDLTLTQDWNLATARAGGEAGVLTLRAEGNLLINSNLSDGFNVATPCSTGACPTTGTVTPATLLTGDSWSYRLIAGADSAAADPLAVRRGADGVNDVTLAAGKLIRTGTGDIRIASGNDIVLAGADSAIYTAGKVADPVSGFVTPTSTLKPVFAQGGGDVGLQALGDISGKPAAQLFSEWLYRQGVIDPATGLYKQQTAWWVRFDQFRQGVGALGGGDVTLQAGGAVTDVSASAPTQGRMGATTPDASQLVVTGGGDVSVLADGDVLGGSYYTGRGELVVEAGGKIAPSAQTINSLTDPLALIVGLGDATVSVRAQGDVEVANLLNPHILPASPGNSVVIPLSNLRRTEFSTYSADSAASVQSLNGQVEFTASTLSTYAFPSTATSNTSTEIMNLASGLLPPSLSLVALQGGIELGGVGEMTLAPSPSGGLSLLAATSIQLKSSISLSDMDPTLLPSPVYPIGTFYTSSTSQPLVPILLITPFFPIPDQHAAVPVHLGDTEPVRVYAQAGDITGLAYAGAVLNMSKPTLVKAGQDIVDLSVYIQHNDAGETSVVEAGRDIVFSPTVGRNELELFRIGGPGSLEVTAGRDLNLGSSGGIVSRGNLDNPNLPSGGADLQLAAGVGAAGIDYVGAVDRLLAALEAGATDDITLWQARWLVGDDTLDASTALAAVRAVEALDAGAQRERVRDLLFTAQRVTGRDANDASSGYGGDFSRGYAALELLFPGIGEKNPDGSFKNYTGTLNLFASRVKTENGGDIEFMAPGGDVIAGLANTPIALVDTGSNVLGIVVAGEGDIKGFARDDMLVNQSRILTVGGGDLQLWSSEGDIDAGKGKKTASAVPPPVVSIDSKGNVTLVLQGAVRGKGIGALSSGGVAAGDVDLIAPRGAVNAGDAGIRAGNLNIAAQVVIGADNISASGTSTGTPVADTSAVTAASSGASNAGGDIATATAALAQNVAEAARAAEELKQSFKPTFISAEVIGHGE